MKNRTFSTAAHKKRYAPPPFKGCISRSSLTPAHSRRMRCYLRFTSAGTPATGARACACRQACCSDHESARTGIDVYRAKLLEQRLVHYKTEPFNLEHIVVISRLIQSQHQLKAPSTRSAVNPYGRYILSTKVVLEFINCALCQLNHVALLLLFRATSTHNIGHENTLPDNLCLI